MLLATFGCTNGITVKTNVKIVAFLVYYARQPQIYKI